MADIKGKWQIGLIPDFNDDGLTFIPRAEAEKSKKLDKDMKFMLKGIYVITDDSMSILMPLKGKEKEEAIAEGMKEVEDGIFEVEVAPLVKKKNKFYFEMGYDEAEDKPHYEELKLDENGYLDYLLFKLERI